MILPKVCFGTFGIEKSPSILVNALEEGIRFFDTAENYDDGQVERFLGIAVNNIREDVIIATKISPENLLTKESIAESIEGSLKRLSTDYIDIYQIHWPHPMSNIEVIVESFQKALTEGKIRSVGICNHSFLQNIEFEKYLQQDFVSIQNEFNLVDNTASASTSLSNIYFLAYSILKQSGVSLEVSSFIEKLKKKYKLTYSQIVLSWVSSFGNCIPIFTSSNKEHIKENLAIFDASVPNLQEDDLVALTSLSKTKVVNIDMSLIRTPVYNHVFCPTSEELAISIAAGMRLKPIKVSVNEDGSYTVVEGRVRYFAYENLGYVPSIILGE